MKYKLTSSDRVVLGVDDVDNGAILMYIPNDPANADWQKYQDWLAADPENQPLPAD